MTNEPQQAPPASPGRTGARLAAVATTDPLDQRTFSGYSAALFTHLTARGISVLPISSRQVRARDLLGGAVHLRGILHGRFRGRRAPRIDPDWYWSAPVVERLSARVDDLIGADGGVTHALQIGTHVLIERPGVQTYCVTDCTVTQSVEADEFAISHASAAGIERAIDWQRRVFDSCELIFTTSKWAAASVIEDYGQAPERVHPIGAGATNIGEPDREANVDRPPTVLFVGYDWKLKGGPLLLEAWREVRRSIRDARLVIVGCTPRIDDPGVEVLGRLDPRVPADRARLIEAYASSTCLALVSDFDAFPNVLLEAGAMGLPVVAFDEQSRSEVVRDGETGILVPGHNAGAVADGLHALLSDPGSAVAMGKRARTRVEEIFTWECVAAQVFVAMGLG